MRSITGWYRIEPRTDDAVPGPDRGLQARLYDPMWLLGRQWQLGELTGEDAASQAWVRVLAASTPIDRLILGSGPPVALAPGSDLEPLVEAEPYTMDWAGSVSAGQHWLSALSAAGLVALADAFRAEYPVPDPDPSGQDAEAGRRFRVLRRNSLDGAALLASVRDATGEVHLPARPAVAPHEQAVLAALQTWAAWYPAASSGQAWVDDRLEYQFSVAASDPGGPGDLVLSAPAYQGGRLDWHAFQAGSVGSGTGADVLRWAHAGLPTRVSYPGMPANRWWELEDGGVSFPLVEAESGDVARMLLVEFASVFGNDWFVAPIDIMFGTVLSVEGVVVTDTFGEATLVEPAQAPGWRMYQVSGAPPGRLVLPCVLSVGSAEGEPIEEVQLTRDEMADLGWAIERTVLGAACQRVNRHERWRDRLASLPERAPEALPNDALVYDLALEPPDHWTPLVPAAAGHRSIRLRRGIFLRGDAQAFPPLGRFLDPSRAFSLFEEEVPRSGLMLTRSWQMARSADGRLLTWIGRRARPGRGESRSQVAFDRTRPSGGPIERA